MIDPIKLVRRWLLGTASVTDLLGTNTGGSIYGGGDLPEKFDPALGPAIQIFVSSGTNAPEIREEVMPRLTIKCWANVNEYALARSVYRAVYDVMHGANMVDFGDDGRVISCQSVTQGQELTDPDTSWVNVVGFFVLDAIQTTPTSLSDFVSDTQTVKDYIDQQIAAGGGGGSSDKIVHLTSNYTLAADENVAWCNGTFTVTLPTSPDLHLLYTVIVETGTVTVQPIGVTGIAGYSFSLRYDGTTWRIV